MNFKGKIKENHGITLVSLIVAIIILLILAGVVLSLAVGEDGIIKKSITSSKQYDISTAKEQVEMLAATYASNYYEEKHLSGNEVPEKIGDYVLEKLETENSVGDYQIYIVDGRIIVRKDEDFASAKIEDDGAIIWDKYPFDPNEITIGEAVDSDRYGDKVDYVSKYEEENGTTLGWRLFYKDSNFAYIILDGFDMEEDGTTERKYKPRDYYEGQDKYANGSRVGIVGRKLNSVIADELFVESNTYDNIKAIAWLTDIEFWDKYKDTNGKALYAIASPTVELYAASFNATQEGKIGLSIGTYGYKFSVSLPNNWNSIFRNGIYNKENNKFCWFASPWYKYNDRGLIQYAQYGVGDYAFSVYERALIRPLVCLAASEITDSIFINEE